MPKTITNGHELPPEESEDRITKRRALERQLRERAEANDHVATGGWRQREASGKNVKSKWRR